jgi:hypothetical protein
MDGQDDGDEEGLTEVKEAPLFEMKDEASLNLLAEVTKSGRTLKVFEPTPGSLMEIEYGSPGFVPPSAPELRLGILEKFEKFSGKKAPPALKEAANRRNALRAKPEADLNASEGQEGRALEGQTVGSISKGSSGGVTNEQWFFDNYCQPVDRFWGDRSWTGPSFWSNRTEYFKAGIYARQGSTVVPSFSCANSGQLSYGSTALPQGSYAAMRCDSVINRAVESRVSNAQGSIYAHCINYHF